MLVEISGNQCSALLKVFGEYAAATQGTYPASKCYNNLVHVLSYCKQH